jgi:hypothetical protein
MLYAEGLISEGFVTHADREDNNLNPKQYQNIIVIEDTAAGVAWMNRNSLTTITQAQAQTSYDSFMDNLLASWEDDERIRPSKETLPS